MREVFISPGCKACPCCQAESPGPSTACPSASLSSSGDSAGASKLSFIPDWSLEVEASWESAFYHEEGRVTRRRGGFPWSPGEDALPHAPSSPLCWFICVALWALSWRGGDAQRPVSVVSAAVALKGAAVWDDTGCTSAGAWCAPPHLCHTELLWQQESEILQNEFAVLTVSPEHTEGNETLCTSFSGAWRTLRTLPQPSCHSSVCASGTEARSDLTRRHLFVTWQTLDALCSCYSSALTSQPASLQERQRPDLSPE